MVLGAIGLVILTTIISLIVLLIIGTLLLMLSASILKQRKVFVPAFKVVLITAVIGVIISFISIVALNIVLSIALIVFNIFLIKTFFKVGWGRALGIWALELAFVIILSLILFAVLRGVVVSVIQGGIGSIQVILPLI